MDKIVSELSTQSQENAPPETLRGRSIFLVETTTSGISVQTSFMTEDGKLLQMPAIFPDVQYAFAQIDELKNLVAQHFSRAAQVGAQVIAQQAFNNVQSSDNSTEKKAIESNAPISS